MTFSKNVLNHAIISLRLSDYLIELELLFTKPSGVHYYSIRLVRNMVFVFVIFVLPRALKSQFLAWSDSNPKDFPLKIKISERKIDILGKIKIFTKKRKFCQKSKFRSKIEILVKNRNFPIEILATKINIFYSKFWSKI